MTNLALVQYTTSIQQLHYLNYIIIEVPPSILEQLPGKFEKGNFNQRLIVRLDETVEWQAGILAMGEGSGCISVQTARLKKLGKTIGDEVVVELFKDESEFGVPVAEELVEYWAQMPETYNQFMQLKPGMQRYILNYVSTVKNPDKRLERTLLLMRNMENCTPGKETFRILLGKEG